MGRQIIYSLRPGDLVRVLATEDIMKNYPDYAHCTGTVIEIRPDEFYTDTQRPDGGPWQVARIFIPGVMNGRPSAKEWCLKEWGEDLELLQEAE